MPMLRFIFKTFSLLVLVVVLGACSSKAQSQSPQVRQVKGVFEYCGLYTPSNTQALQRALHTNHPDYDWGVWGHNLHKIVNEALCDEMYATVNGTKTSKQFCFSSAALYKAVRAYILDQFGEGTDTYSERISIMPMDNQLACTCNACRAKGNTSSNATPAVSDFVMRLAKEFPRHQFFTSAYHTTKAAPQVALPKNVGVFISSYPMPMRVDLKKTEGYQEFSTMVEAWKKKCDKIYVWDYERNYSDYLSPFPCLLALQSRFKLYRDLGVRGVFVNGSGDDYSAFDDMQTQVLAALLNNPDADVKQTVNNYFAKYYPQTHKLLMDYYWQLETRVQCTNHLLPLYGTMQDVCAAYLNAAEFVHFRAQLDAASKQTVGEERKRLNELLTALAYTQLELYRSKLLPLDKEQAIEMREILKGHSEIKGMVNRDEPGNTIDDYLKQWK